MKYVRNQVNIYYLLKKNISDLSNVKPEMNLCMVFLPTSIYFVLFVLF